MKAAIDMRRRALMVLMVAILAIAAAMTNGLTSAESAGTSFPFIVFAGPPGSPAQVYNGHYWGGTNWVENQYDNAFTSHQSEMIYDNGKDVVHEREQNFTTTVISTFFASWQANRRRTVRRWRARNALSVHHWHVVEAVPAVPKTRCRRAGWWSPMEPRRSVG